MMYYDDDDDGNMMKYDDGHMMIMNYNSQAACFHLPRLIWKHSEGGLMKMLVGNLTDPMMIINVTFIYKMCFSFFFTTFIIFINYPVLERGQIGQDPVHQEVLQGDFVNDGDDDDLCKLV